MWHNTGKEDENMIQRRDRDERFTPITSRLIRDKEISTEAVGVFARMAIKPDNWEFNEFAMANELRLPRESVHVILLELERKGYVRQRRGRYGTVWDLYESPDTPTASHSLAVEPLEPIPARPGVIMPEPLKEGEQLTPEEMGQRLKDFAKKLAANRDLNRAIR